jgi:hypothetical protein
MDFYFLIYGVRVRSNRPIPRARAIPPQRFADLDIQLSEAEPREPGLRPADHEPWYASGGTDAEGQPLLAISKIDGGAQFKLRYSDETEFLVDRDGTSVRATWSGESTIDDTATYLLGPVMGFVLLLRGVHSLHASAVAVGEQAIAIVGPAGAGKSTTAAAFARLGYGVLSEDVVALESRDGHLHVQPAYPCIRLWPESVQALFGSPDALPLLTPNWDKRYLDLGNGSGSYQQTPLRLAAIYVLGDRCESSITPRVETLSASTPLIALTGNSYVPYLKDKEARAQEFDLLKRVVATVPVRRVIPHSDPGRVARLCEVILDDFAELPAPDASAAPAVEIEHV